MSAALQSITHARRGAQPSLEVATLSHDMKTPLTAIEIYNSLLSDMDPDDPDRAQFHEIIADQVRRLARMADTVLTFSDVGVPDAGLRLETILLPSLLKDTVQLYRRLHADRGYDFVLEMSGPLPPVRADQHALGRVFNNLLDNAVKYSDPHAVRILAYAERRHAQPQVALEFKDRGHGIAEGRHARLFEPYDRADYNGPAGGTGLGLSIAREIVDAHGGRIDVRSARGEGTTFRVLLPAERGSPNHACITQTNQHYALTN